ncbi:CYTH domain-containing protein [Anaeromicropila herbilytica]|uniref:CYTH domain-containing protein n=1 Tax=Anaeromicropila herbilytica TaxID=2785025 RepID=A0A7R7EMQ0_9FIRM|nr:CYTH domain-containing protein [Anaeromicropila herbilytica]BCN31706.1 hypothetical protein bsdtb5_30010 [Anaeromicropila herbilytica]
MEIEKKFTIKTLPDKLEQYNKKKIEQGYLSTNPIVRIRKSNEDYILTYKSKFGLPEQAGKDLCVNNEVELPLTKEAYEHLREKVDNNLIRKTRYLIPLESNLTAELDIFEGRLKGLFFAEVEFTDEESAKDFNKPDWFDEDVSADKRYGNSYLSKIESLDELR